MKRIILVLALVCLPFLAFAQTQPQQRGEAQFLKQQLGLNDSQVSQVLAIQQATARRVRADGVHLRLLRAQIEEAMLPQTVDQAKVNRLIDQTARTRADSQKALIDARIRLRSIMGDGAFRLYLRAIRGRLQGRSGFSGRAFPRFNGPRYFGQGPSRRRGTPGTGRYGYGYRPEWAPMGGGGSSGQ